MAKKLTQPEIILKYLRDNPNTWYFSYELRGRETPYGFAGHQADRRARDMAEKGIIDVRHEGKFAQYRAKPPLKVEQVFGVLPNGERVLVKTNRIWK